MNQIGPFHLILTANKPACSSMSMTSRNIWRLGKMSVLQVKGVSLESTFCASTFFKMLAETGKTPLT